MTAAEQTGSELTIDTNYQVGSGPFSGWWRKRGVARSFSPSRIESKELTLSVKAWGSGFSHVVVINPCLDVVALGQAFRFFERFEFSAAFIAPAAFRDEPIPELDLLRVGPPEIRETPFENLIVRTAGQRALD